jgi:predicted nucleotidyltransferase
MTAFGISADHYIFLGQVFEKHFGGSPCQIWIFGSRATGLHQKYSDVDLLIESSVLNARLLSRLAEALEESPLPFKVDLVDVRKLVPEYADEVHASKKLFWSSGSGQVPGAETA